MTLRKVWLLTDNSALADSAKSFTWPYGLRLSVFPFGMVTNLQASANDTIAIIVDARDIDEATRALLAKIGKAQQRIVFGDKRFDNILGKIHLASSATIEEIAQGIDSVESFLNPSYRPKTLKTRNTDQVTIKPEPKTISGGST